jgi:hypothetical protein
VGPPPPLPPPPPLTYRSLEFTKQAVGSARRAKPAREIMGAEVKVSRTLSAQPCASPPPLPPALSLVFSAPMLPIDLHVSNPPRAAFACVADILETLKLQEYLPLLMCAPVAFCRSISLCFKCAAHLPPLFPRPALQEAAHHGPQCVPRD